MSEIVAFVVRLPLLSHCIVALVLMAILCPILQLFRVHGFAWLAALCTSVFFYAREAAEAERALKPTLGDPKAFFVTLWPGNWNVGGAHLTEWLMPTFVVIIVAILTPRRPFLFRGSVPPMKPPR